MTTSNPKKMFKQLKAKPAKLAKFIKHNLSKKRTMGVANHSCRRCGSHRGFISRYGLGYCRRCFREVARAIGFKKYS